MKLSKKEELLALGSALYLVGIEVEASRERLETLYEQGHSLCSKEILEETERFNRLSWRFTQLEERYLCLEKAT